MQEQPITWSGIDVTGTIKQTLLQTFTSFVEHFPFLITGCAIVLITWLAAALSNRFARSLLKRWHRSHSLQELISRLIAILIWAVGILIAAMVVLPGLTPTRALGAMGVVSIAIGLAFRDIFENFFAGILILMRYPFGQNDFIECDKVVGKVERINVRVTMIRRVTGELVVMPNSTFMKNPVEVLTNQSKRRISIIAGIAYGEDIASAVTVIEQALKSCQTVASNWPLEIYPQGFGTSSIDIEIAWWADPKPGEIRRSRGEVVTAVKAALDEAGIEIPFPYRTLVFKEPMAVSVPPAG